MLSPIPTANSHCLIAVLVGFLLFPDQIAQLTGSEKWLREAYPMLRQ